METTTTTIPDIDTDLLLTHLEYADWATQKTFDMVDKLPAEAIASPICSSFASILDTLRHLYQWNQYYFTHMLGGRVALEEIVPPSTYAELKEAMPKLHAQMLAWAREHLSDHKHDVLHGWATWPTWMIVMQIANHYTHHLGQVLTLVRQAGYVPLQSDWTDLILYYLKRYPQER